MLVIVPAHWTAEPTDASEKLKVRLGPGAVLHGRGKQIFVTKLPSGTADRQIPGAHAALLYVRKGRDSA